MRLPNRTVTPCRRTPARATAAGATLLLCFLLPLGGFGQSGGPALTTVKDTAYKSDGSPATGSVVISWDSFLSQDAKPIFGGSKTVTLNSGALLVGLIPNIGATPAGTSYTVRYYQSGAIYAEEFWVVPNSAPTAPPAQPSVVNIGTQGSNTYCYWISAVKTVGETNLSAAGCTSSGHNSLSTNNFNRVSWTAVSGAVNYRVFRTTSNVAPVGTGQFLVAATASLTVDDQTGTLQSATIPEVNSTDPRTLQQVRVTVPPSQSVLVSPLQVTGTAIVSAPTSTQTITAPASSGTPLQIRAQTSNSGNLLNIFDSPTSPTPKSWFNSSGAFVSSLAPVLNNFTSGSILFAGSGGQMSENNASLFWDAAADRLRVGPRSGFSTLLQGAMDVYKHTFTLLNPPAGPTASFGAMSQSNDPASYNFAAYAASESTHSSGNRAASIGLEADAYHSGIGTITDLFGLFGFADNLAPAGGNATRVSAMAANAWQSGSATTSEMMGLRLLSNGKSGGTVLNNYGLKIEDQTAGDSNWAIKTGAGKVDFGGPLTAARMNNVRFADQFAGADAGAKITAAVADLPSTGGTVDACGFEGPQSAAATIALSKPVKLKLCAITLTLSGSPGIELTANSTIEGAGEGVTDLRPGGNFTLLRINGGPATVNNLSMTGLSASFPTAKAIHLVGGHGQTLQNLRITDWGGVPLTIEPDSGVFMTVSNSLIQPANPLATLAILINGNDTTATHRHIHAVDTGGAVVDIQGARTTVITSLTAHNITMNSSVEKLILGNSRFNSTSTTTVNGINHSIVGNVFGNTITLGSTVAASVIGPNVSVGPIVNNTAAANNAIIDHNSYALFPRLGVGAETNPSSGMFLRPTTLSGTNQFGLQAAPIATSAATSAGIGGVFRADTAAEAFTQSSNIGIYIQNAVKGAGSSIANQYGLFIEDMNQGTNRWQLYSAGSAPAEFAGPLVSGSSLQAPYFRSSTSDVADGGLIRLASGEAIASEAGPAGADGTILYNGSNQWEMNSPLAFDGATADGNKSIITVTDPTATRTLTLPNADSNPVQPAACSGTDKISAISSAGVITCSADQGGSGSGGDNVRVEDGDNAGTFTAMSDVDFDDSGDIDFQRLAGSPDSIIGVVRANSLALTTDTTGNYVGSIADGTGIDASASGEGATYTPTLDLTEINSHAFGDNSTGTLTQTFDPTGATNPAWSYSNGVANLSTGTLQQGGTGVALQSVTLTAGNGLTGGGDISTNRTFDIAVTSPIEISSDSVACSTCTTASNSQTLTNKTFDAEATGNVLVFPQKIEFQAAGCDGSTAASAFDLPTANAPSKSCQGTSPHRFGTLDFADGASALTSSARSLLPSDWTSTGGVDIKFVWSSASTSTNSVVWTVQTVCVADGEDVSNPTFNSVQTVSDSNNATANTRNSATITGITMTGCAGGESLFLKIGRDPTNGSDTLAATALLHSVEVTIRRQI